MDPPPSVQRDGVRPCVYVRVTDNCGELTVRVVVREHGIREQKDAIPATAATGPR